MTDPITTALARIQEIMSKWVHPASGMTDRDALLEVLAAADDQEVVRTMREEATPYGLALVVDEPVTGPHAEAFLADLDDQAAQIEAKPQINSL